MTGRQEEVGEVIMGDEVLAEHFAIGTVRELLKVIIFGMLIGIIVWGATLLLQRTLAGVSAAVYSEAIATLLGAGLALFFLIKMQIARPLLLVIAVTASYWGIIAMIGQQLPWYGVLTAVASLYGMGYGLFMWLSRITSFIVVIISFAIVIAGIRLYLSV